MSRGPQLGEAGLCAVPDDVLSATVLARLECPRDVARLSSASKRFNALAGCENLWRSLYCERWGEPGELTRRAAAIAGGYRRLYGSKDVTEKAAAPWTKPCPEELRASVEKLATRLVGDVQQVNVVFLVDGSGSVNAEEFEAMLGFCVDASNQLAESVPNLQVAVVQFSNDVRVEVGLAPLDSEALRKTTREMVRMNGGTNVAVALTKAGQLLKRDAAPDAMRHVVLLTDGRVDSYQAHEARQVADQLADEQRHVSLFAYGVGRGVDRAELLHIIGGPPTCAHVPVSHPHYHLHHNLHAGGQPPQPPQPPAQAPPQQVVPVVPVQVVVPVPVPAAVPQATQAAGGGDAAAAATTAAALTAGFSVCLSAFGEAPEERYLLLCARDEEPW
ncbi:hypothetical protein CHLRE_12g518800v5 [Chlamydomonas reinhardtii]|uniref:Uncharacterized protein n=1 Tax=Chlamydomonas reinhardtii TaxID=3055 RepID=A8J658_CHLRE|nr:uncharacterized protein CHLRE_12g518800v5 [Chlamydomonas reinhardtii]PNW75243.1 hypothetical protein CHLRE_12g518800v5 [Chlamydomonas reinhardtii]|eukprot:XP_001697073.1 collagen-related protein [Chlamydomonas reinhardtii]